jgi:hypothetical protein
VSTEALLTQTISQAVLLVLQREIHDSHPNANRRGLYPFASTRAAVRRGRRNFALQNWSVRQIKP